MKLVNFSLIDAVCLILADRLPSAGMAHAVRAARQHEALLATHEGDRARTVLADDDVIDL